MASISVRACIAIATLAGCGRQSTVATDDGGSTTGTTTGSPDDPTTAPPQTSQDADTTGAPTTANTTHGDTDETSSPSSTATSQSGTSSDTSAASREDTVATDGSSTGRASATDATTDGTGGDATSTTGTTGDGAGNALDPWFVEVAAEVGMDHVADLMASPPGCLIDAVDPPVAGLFCSPERIAGGAAIVDVDRDGDLDVYVTRPYSPDLMYLNDGAGTFVDAADAMGLGDTLATSGAAFGDIDGDGDEDLYVTSLGDFRNYLFVNEDGVFVEDGLDRGAGIESEYQHAGSTPAFGDYDLDGDLDLYVGEWMTHALGVRPSHARLLRNLGPDAPGTFEDVTESAGLVIDDVYLEVGSSIAGTFVFSAAWSDLDGDDYPDLLLANDFATSRLFWNAGDGSFVDGTVASGVGTDENGMGSTVGDYDGDGDLDWFVTSILGAVKNGNRLYHNAGNRTFADATDAAGVRDASWAWGTSFVDMDLDGDLDLTATNGWYGTDELVDPMVAWINDGSGHFAEVAAAIGLDDTSQGRGLVTFDADDDGDAEVLVVGVGGAVKLYRNDGELGGNHWLRVRAPGTTSNGAGLGAVVTVAGEAASQIREIDGTSHFLGHGPREAHFGLGNDALVDVEVRWPASGAIVSLVDVAADQILVVPEPE